MVCELTCSMDLIHRLHRRYWIGRRGAVTIGVILAKQDIRIVNVVTMPVNATVTNVAPVAFPNKGKVVIVTT